MKIYNLFPLLAGPFGDWQPHIARAADMGFDWIFVNPVQKTGQSGSLYSIADYFELDPIFLLPDSDVAADQQLKNAIRQAELESGLKMMTDLVINHCAVDAKIVKEHPQWFRRNEDGSVVNPFCMENGQKVVWHDLAQFDHTNSSDAEGLYQFFLSIVEHFIELGFKGFRCDAAYQIPQYLWHRLINDVKAKNADIIFVAETLGCTAEETKQTALAGFDFVFNSSKWWDFSSHWLIEQYQLIREYVPSISFPESHDTERLYTETHQNIEALKQRYLFAAVFSTGVMIPMGFEFAFQKKLHVVETRPTDWEENHMDLTQYIIKINELKSTYRVLQEEGPINIISNEHSPVLFFWKASSSAQEEALVIINKDIWQKQYFRVDNIYHYIQSRNPLIDHSPEFPLTYIPTPFEFELNPGMTKILIVSRTPG